MRQIPLPSKSQKSGDFMQILFKKLQKL